MAKARWPAEVHSLSRTDFQRESRPSKRECRVPITDLRWVVAHVPFITEDYVNRRRPSAAASRSPAGATSRARPSTTDRPSA